MVGKDSEVFIHEYHRDLRVALGLVADSEVIFFRFGNLCVDELVLDEISHKVLLFFPNSAVYGDFIRVFISVDTKVNITFGVPFCNMLKSDSIPHEAILSCSILKFFRFDHQSNRYVTDRTGNSDLDMIMSFDINAEERDARFYDCLMGVGLGLSDEKAG